MCNHLCKFFSILGTKNSVRFHRVIRKWTTVYICETKIPIVQVDTCVVETVASRTYQVVSRLATVSTAGLQWTCRTGRPLHSADPCTPPALLTRLLLLLPRAHSVQLTEPSYVPRLDRCTHRCWTGLHPSLAHGSVARSSLSIDSVRLDVRRPECERASKRV